MGDYQNGAFHDFAAKFDFYSYKTVLDVGGAGANLSIAVAKQNPHLSCETLDLPAVFPIAQANIDKFDLSSRVSLI